MGNINLQSLINEVLSMAKGSEDLRKKKLKDDEVSRVNQSWDDTPAGQAYWKDIRGRNTQMEVGRMQNAGQMDVARENNTGQLARQTLMEDTKRIDDTRDYNLNLYKEKVNENVGRFNAQTQRQTAMTKQSAANETAGSKEDPRAALFTALSQPGITDPEKVNIRKTFDSIYGAGQPPQGVLPPQQGQSVPGIAPPDVTKKGDYFTKDTPVQSPVKEASSMEFASDEVLKKRKLMDRNKKVEEDMFGKPKRSSFLPW